MFYGNSVQDTRQMFFLSWKKYQNQEPLQPLEKQIVEVILDHPEYHKLLDTVENEVVYSPELGQANPFLHMGLHLAIRDQITLNRPVGISPLFQQLMKKYADRMMVEHLLMERLAECLWQAQRLQTAPNETQYLQACRQLLTAS